MVDNAVNQTSSNTLFAENSAATCGFANRIIQNCWIELCCLRCKRPIMFHKVKFTIVSVLCVSLSLSFSFPFKIPTPFSSTKLALHKSAHRNTSMCERLVVSRLVTCGLNNFGATLTLLRAWIVERLQIVEVRQKWNVEMHIIHHHHQHHHHH